MHLLQRRGLQPVQLHLRRLLRKGARLNRQLPQADTVIALYLTYHHEELQHVVTKPDRGGFYHYVFQGSLRVCEPFWNEGVSGLRDAFRCFTFTQDF